MIDQQRRLRGLGDLSGGRPAAVRTASVFRPRIRLRGLEDMTCRIDPVTGGRVCSNDPVTTVTTSPVAQIGPFVPAPMFPDGTLIKGSSGPAVSIYSGGQRRWIPDPATFTAMGLNWSDIRIVSDAQYNAIPQGPAYASIITMQPQPVDPNAAAASGVPVAANPAPVTIQPTTPAAALPTTYVSSSPMPTMSGGGGMPSWVIYVGAGVGGLILLKMLGVIGKK
jgi:hypothetical protein